MTPFERDVRQALAELLPAMEPDGGGAEVVEFNPPNITLRLLGSCLFCPSRKLSAAALERGMRDRVPGLMCVDVQFPALGR